MSNENIVCSHELVVRLDQLEDGTVNWLVQPSEAIANTTHASFDEMVDAGAPLSALGIRALWELMGDKLVHLALEQANGYLWKSAYRQLTQQAALETSPVEGELVSDAEDAVVIH